MPIFIVHGYTTVKQDCEEIRSGKMHVSLRIDAINDHPSNIEAAAAVKLGSYGFELVASMPLGSYDSPSLQDADSLLNSFEDY